MPEYLWAALDRHRESTGISRSDFVQRTLEPALSKLGAMTSSVSQEDRWLAACREAAKDGQDPLEILSKANVEVPA